MLMRVILGTLRVVQIRMVFERSSQVRSFDCDMSSWPSKRAQNNGPISQNREYRQNGIHYFGHFGGPGWLPLNDFQKFRDWGRRAVFRVRGVVKGGRGYLNLQNCQNNGLYSAYTLYFGILGRSFGLFWRSRYICRNTCQHHFEVCLKYLILELY